jgi:hypothetical protein
MSSHKWTPTKKLNQFQQLVQERFTNAVEIYYENHVHKKFLADIYAVIPKGKKCAVWFTNKQCWMFQIAKRPYHQHPPQQSQQSQQPQQPRQQQLPELVTFDDVRMLTMPCMDDAWYHGDGTILYGTYMFDKTRFSVENVHCLCGAKQQNDGSMKRFIDFFDSLKQCKMELPLQFFMPVMHVSFNDALKDALAITSYDVFCIQHRFLNRNCTEHKNLLIHLAEPHQQMTPVKAPAQSFFPKQSHAPHANPSVNANVTHATATAPRPMSTPMPVPMHTFRVPPTQPQRTFMVKPDMQNDIYYVLHNKDDPITERTMIAHIPNYKTSVMMNSIFRNIKENRNLDALEESDDEEESVEREHHVIDMNKCVRMTCVFNNRFKRWQPCECV